MPIYIFLSEFSQIIITMKPYSQNKKTNRTIRGLVTSYEANLTLSNTSKTDNRSTHEPT